VRSELFHVDAQMDGQTQVKKLLVAFCNFAKNDILFSVALWCSAIGRYNKDKVNGCRNGRISRNPNTALGDIRFFPLWSWMILLYSACFIFKIVYWCGSRILRKNWGLSKWHHIPEDPDPHKAALLCTGKIESDCFFLAENSCIL